MGNISYTNFTCNNYYCQSVSFKPEWFSEITWNIEYNNINNSIKPYIIEKGILKIKEIDKSIIFLSKKLFINFNEVRNISIPLIFKYYLYNNNYIDLFIIISNKKLEINDINNLSEHKDNIFFINLKLLNKYLYINHSFNSKIIKKKIKCNQQNLYNIEIENNYEMLLLTEKIFNNIEEKYIINYSFNEYNDYYLNIFILNNDMDKNEFIELTFE